MKIFINNRDYVTWPSAMAEILSNQGHEVIFLDNASTWEPLLDWYATCPFEVRRLKNVGPWVHYGEHCLAEKERFVFTDPDYDISMIPDDWPEALQVELDRFPNSPKCGLSFDMSRVPQENYSYAHKERLCPKDNPEYGLMVTWGGVRKDGAGYMDYPVATSFAVYRPGLGIGINGNMRARPYTGLHLPFHLLLEPSADPTKLSIIIDDEIAYYHKNATPPSNSRGHLADVIKEYYRRKSAAGL